jgi:hypothetical protein
MADERIMPHAAGFGFWAMALMTLLAVLVIWQHMSGARYLVGLAGNAGARAGTAFGALPATGVAAAGASPSVGVPGGYGTPGQDWLNNRDLTGLN